jgi:hypothetical protein
LDGLDFDARSCLVFDEHKVPVAWVVFVVRTFRQSNPVVFRVVTDAVLLPRHRVRECSPWTRRPSSS